MNIVFMGTPQFADVSLLALIQTYGKEKIKAVFCQSDKPSGRGMKLTPPPTKITAQNYNIPVFQPKSLKNEEVISTLKSLGADIFVVVAYGKILQQEVLDIPKYGCVNVHASILPKYRGASPINAAILNGERTTGVCTMQMDAGIDSGDIIDMQYVQITEQDNFGILHDKLAQVGANLLLKTLNNLANGKAKLAKQDHSMATYAPKITQESKILDFNKSAQQILYQIKSLSPSPLCETTIGGKRVKIVNAALHSPQTKHPSGTVCNEGTKLIIYCGEDSAIEVQTLIPEGKQAMLARAFLNGYKI